MAAVRYCGFAERAFGHHKKLKICIVAGITNLIACVNCGCRRLRDFFGGGGAQFVLFNIDYGRPYNTLVVLCKCMIHLLPSVRRCMRQTDRATTSVNSSKVAYETKKCDKSHAHSEYQCCQLVTRSATWI